MKISERYNLSKTQAELDFIDIDTSEDMPLFLDPFFLGTRTDKWSINASRTIRSFFQKVIDLIISKKENEAKALFDYLHEPNSTCLGMSIGKPRGRGVGFTDTDKIYNSLSKSKAIQTGLVRDIEDSTLFIDNFGKDKLSDMATNIITGHLVEYTKNQCNLHDIPLTENIPSGYFWDSISESWITEYSEMLVVEGEVKLLVPKGIVSFAKSYTPDRYCQHYVLNFLQNEHLRLNTALVEKRTNGERYVTKKSLKEQLPKEMKEFLRDFTIKHPELLERFKNETKIESLNNLEFSEFNVNKLIDSLTNRLLEINSGRDTADDFHNIIIGILEVIFYPHLLNPTKEYAIHQGRKRVDITFDNGAKDGIFNRLSNNMGIPSSYIYVECKNYSTDVANPELDQLSGRFSVNNGQVGFLVCRSINNMELFIERCRDTYKDGRGLVIPIVDDDINELLKNYNDWDYSYTEKFLSDRIRKIVIS
ncbi:hypothetical protein [uncultured Maribacter sp.]|uniref:hypothetical protein n=1 Tax=uncultured Maribacter sp. TaxID=431308 RepID=UPI00260F0DF3|nr:hypothetical protein [uncultured Maribacter sp.]